MRPTADGFHGADRPDPAAADRTDPAAHAPFDRTENFEVLRPGGGEPRARTRAVPVEAPVAIEFNGIGYAVMMATPAELEDFVTGFAAAEQLVAPGTPLPQVETHRAPNGWIARATLAGKGRDIVLDRARRRVAESSCGLCGIENLEALARPLPPVDRPLKLTEDALFAALSALRDHQPRAARTAAMHAAALCRADGRIVLAREDVGRHNALDKAVGARLRKRIGGDLFALLTARCSYELVEKAVLAGLGGLVTISMPTTLAIDRAREAGLPLHVLAREDAVLRVI